MSGAIVEVAPNYNRTHGRDLLILLQTSVDTGNSKGFHCFITSHSHMGHGWPLASFHPVPGPIADLSRPEVHRKGQKPGQVLPHGS